MPRTENATETARMAIKDGRRACILMPTELVYCTAQEPDRTFNPKIVDAIKSAVKLTLMANDTTWLCLGTSIVHNDVRSGEHTTTPPGLTSEEWSKELGSLEYWVHEQLTSLAEEAGKLNMSQVRYDSGKLV